ncbi:MAG TPA: tRNA preQ1(34) S-adenosylmethionine ribosyltransferase-isomerase QueA [Candidatus Baltobacteraceae bacterium]|nr:tRNA preQ1(34) S-adenosylmethionine ribosyltransferase-isomerase QueA [Candidatus Baltobacteraceae bacterium]
MRTSDFDYALPEKLIAQKPASPREAAKLMVIDRMKDSLTHAKVKDLPAFVKKGDVMVVNVSKVFKARLTGRLDGAKKSGIELFLVRPEGKFWRALGRPGRKLEPGSKIAIARGFAATVQWKDADGSILVDFGMSKDAVIRKANLHGDVPLPPYIKRKPRSPAEYQTAYAKTVGSVAAPTAGFHLTKALMAKLKKKGVTFLEVTLHVGLGTFMPIRSEELEEHKMHAEQIEIPERTAREILRAKVDGRRVIAVGTTTLRALEGAAERCGGKICPWHGDVDLFITPGFRFRVVDALMTNFHLPKSTLLVLVSALAGRERILRAYKEAVRRKYRFFSYGDATLIV